MNRRNLAFLFTLNAVVSLVIALVIVWFFDTRRPDPEELAAINAPRPSPILAATAPPAAGAVTPLPSSGTPSPATGDATTAPTPTLPVAEEVYVVQPGDSLLAIATRYGVTVDDLVRFNNLANPDFVFSGQRLVIPTGGVLPEPESDSAPTAEPVVEGIELSAVTSPGDLPNEAVLVVNQSNAAISLQGWRLEREGGPAYLFGTVPIFPGATLRLHSTSGTDSSIDLYWGQPSAQWPPGTIARLLNPQGTVVSTLTAQ